ncbi:hypothetical protein [Sphingomonas sp. G-3-2-10]|uniref:hypothetical protein n=1 Tax=Sphingomonas sp. G-3-2-10 TaxID=2728838 RepID=UPI00146CBA63|nr:hypothetical protein [Sphingomonas sp. G-3-2-10]NML06440.1 hypothetical protein [Sphingomonas sp. G-3-2-10]
METLRYSQTKLLTMTILCGLTAAVFLWVFLNPESVAEIRRARLFATGFGHAVLAPLLVLLCLCVAWRGALIMVGDRKAVEALPDGLVITTWWRSRRIAWADFGNAEIRLNGWGKHKAWELVILYRSGDAFGSSTAKLALGTTELHEARYDEFARALNATGARYSGGRQQRSVPESEALAPTSFDADAALANYLAKKASGATEAPRAAVRTGFGRKGL